MYELMIIMLVTASIGLYIDDEDTEIKYGIKIKLLKLLATIGVAFMFPIYSKLLVEIITRDMMDSILVSLLYPSTLLGTNGIQMAIYGKFQSHDRMDCNNEERYKN